MSEEEAMAESIREFYRGKAPVDEFTAAVYQEEEDEQVQAATEG